MKYTEVVDRINRVIKSCRTEKQLEFADRYCHRLVNRQYKKGTEAYIKRKEFYDYLEKTLKERIKELCLID